MEKVVCIQGLSAAHEPREIMYLCCYPDLAHKIMTHFIAMHAGALALAAAVGSLLIGMSAPRREPDSSTGPGRHVDGQRELFESQTDNKTEEMALYDAAGQHTLDGAPDAAWDAGDSQSPATFLPATGEPPMYLEDLPTHLRGLLPPGTDESGPGTTAGKLADLVHFRNIDALYGRCARRPKQHAPQADDDT